MVLLYTFLRARIRETPELETLNARVWDPSNDLFWTIWGPVLGPKSLATVKQCCIWTPILLGKHRV